MLLRHVSAALFFVGAGAVHAQCGAALSTANKQQLDSPQWALAYAASTWPIPVGQHFSLEVQVCPKQAQELPQGIRVDADMPAHRHGMNYKPRVQALGPGVFRVEGMMFHMPGAWRLMFELGAVRVEQAIEAQ